MRTILVLSLLTATAFAKGPTGMRMGGVGYLMPDGNNFNNSSQMPMTMGFGIQGLYQRQEIEILSESMQVAMPSAVWGNGKIGLGTYVTRAGTSLTESGDYSDAVGGAMGVAFAGGRMSLGVGYGRGIGEGQSDDGTLRADFALNALKGSGLIFGVGGSTTINAVTRTRTANIGVGYQFSVNNSVEAYYAMNDLDDSQDTTMAGFVTLGGKMVYFGGGFNYLNVGELKQAVGRLGVRLGNQFDISGLITYTFDDDVEPAYGGTFRLMF